MKLLLYGKTNKWTQDGPLKLYIIPKDTLITDEWIFDYP